MGFRVLGEGLFFGGGEGGIFFWKGRREVIAGIDVGRLGCGGRCLSFSSWFLFFL